MARITSRLSYANVMATVAVFVALGGASYAAITLPANSVGSRQIKNRQVKHVDLARNAVTSSNVKNFSLLAQDFKSGQLPAGPAGPPGPVSSTAVRADIQDVGQGFISGETAVINHVNLPAGSWVLEENFNGRNEETTKTTRFDCTMLNGSTALDFAKERMGPAGSDSFEFAQIPMLGVVTLSAPATISVSCTDTNANATASERHLVAVPAAGIS